VGREEDGRLAVATVARQRFDESASSTTAGSTPRAVPLVEQAGERRHRMPRLIHARCGRHQRVAGDAGEEALVHLLCCGDGIGEVAHRRHRIAVGEAFAVQVCGPAADAWRADGCGQDVQRIAIAGRGGVVAGVAGRQPEVGQREKPYLFDDDGRYAVRLPAAQTGTRGRSRSPTRPAS
jgi:hypothetical protein